jgi:hypothetical protein
MFNKAMAGKYAIPAYNLLRHDRRLSSLLRETRTTVGAGF